MALALVLVAGCKSEGEIAHDQAQSAKQACVAGDGQRCAEACAQNIMLEGPDERREVCGRACKNGSADSCQALGRLYDAKDAKALQFFEQGCKLGSGAACTDAGDLVDDTVRGEAGRLRTFALWAEGCEKGSDRGCLRGGRLLMLQKKHSEAAALLKKCWRKQRDGSFGVRPDTACTPAYGCASGEFFDGSQLDDGGRKQACAAAFGHR